MQHVEELLALRDGTPEGEARYRAQVLQLVGARRIPDLPLPGGDRRAEGSLSLGGARGVVLFATGLKGRGNLTDVRSKNGGTSARSLLNEEGVDFVLLVTTTQPTDRLLAIAEEKSGGSAPGLGRPRIWVMGLPEIVSRANYYLSLEPRPLPQGWWQRFKERWAMDDRPVRPESPLLLG